MTSWGLTLQRRGVSCRMISTQIEIPDVLFREANRLAAENEMSFAEFVQRGLEEMVRNYPQNRIKPEDLALPKTQDLGDALVSEEDWTVPSNQEESKTSQ